MSLDVVRPARSFPPSASFAFNFALKNHPLQAVMSPYMAIKFRHKKVTSTSWKMRHIIRFFLPYFSILHPTLRHRLNSLYLYVSASVTVYLYVGMFVCLYLSLSFSPSFVSTYFIYYSFSPRIRHGKSLPTPTICWAIATIITHQLSKSPAHSPTSTGAFSMWPFLTSRPRVL